MSNKFDEWIDTGNRAWIVLFVILFVASLGFLAVHAGYDQYLMRWIIPHIGPEFAIETNNATDITTNSAILHGNITGAENVTAWFEYGQQAGSYSFKTANQSLYGNTSFSATIEGVHLFPGTTYYFRAAGNNSTTTLYGEDLNFTTSSLSAFEDKDFDKHYAELESSNFNLTDLATVLPKSYTDLMVDSRIFYGIFFGVIFLAMWIRQEDVTIPALLGMVVGGAIWVFFTGELLRLAQALFIISFAGLVYSLIKGRGG